MITKLPDITLKNYYDQKQNSMIHQNKKKTKNPIFNFYFHYFEFFQFLSKKIKNTKTKSSPDYQRI